METPVSESEQIWSASHSSLIRTALLTLALLMALARAEAATAYDFIGFDAPLDGVVSTTISGVDYKSGILVGRYTDVYGNAHGWRGNKNSATMVPLMPLNGINRLKWTVGSFTAANGERQGFLLKGTAMIPITIPDCSLVYARAVNETGEVVGDCDGGPPVWHWHDGVVTVLASPDDGAGCEQFGFRATGITAAGAIVGDCGDGGYLFHQGVYTVFNGDTRNPAQAYIYPSGINEKGTIYGLADEFLGDGGPPAQWAGFILKNGVMSFVAYPGAEGTYVTGVHPTNGRIWGNWWGSDGHLHAFTATPTPGMAAR
jgi:hypothetical protein